MSSKKNKKVVLACSECFSRNYTFNRGSFSSDRKIELIKYCPKCNKHVLHKETK